MDNENEILTSKEFWGEIDVHIEKTADELISELHDRKIKGKINSNRKELCMN